MKRSELSDNSKPYKVIIIGAGISGLAIAILLKNLGMEIQIYEREETIRHIGGGLGIWPNGSRVLHQLFGNTISQLSGTLPFDSIILETTYGKHLSTTPLDIFREIDSSPNLFICRSELQSVLLQTISTDRIIWNKHCQRVISDEQKVTVIFSDGEETSCDLLIAADGIFSKIRHQLFSQFQLEYSGYITLGGIIPNDLLPDNFANVTIAPKYMNLLFPIANNRHYQFSASPYPYSHLSKLGQDRTQQLQWFKGKSHTMDAVLQALEISTKSNSEHYFCLPVFDMPLLPQFHQNRIVLIGDAAHPIGPLLGLGTSLALCGAACLAQNLQRQSNLNDALEWYSKQQRSIAASLIQIEIQEKETFLTEDDEAFLLRCDTIQKTSTPQAWASFIAACKNEAVIG